MEYAYKRPNAWKSYGSELDRLKMAEFAREYIEFLSRCKTERETVAWALETLEKADFGTGDETIVRPLRGKALFAAHRGTASLADGLNLIASHGDSPRLDFKQHPLREEAGVIQARTHYYGGIRKYQWLARPLALHGVIVLSDGRKVTVNLGDEPHDPVFCVADLLPHLAKDQQGKKLSEAFDGEKLNVILGHEPELPSSDDAPELKTPIKSQLLQILHARYDVAEEDLITAELEVVPAGRARFVGFDQSLVGGYGQDDRICVFCAIQALVAASRGPLARPVAVILWDKEETGSEGATGAASQFLRYCLEDAARAWGDVAPSQLLLNTRAISADVTAALDPDYKDVHEEQNAAMLGSGPCFEKVTGHGGKYGASEADAEFFALLRRQLNEAQIPWQAAELGKVDSGGGGTVALFLAALGMNVIDCGPALLSMHSPFEVSSVADLYATYAAYQTFLQSA